MTEETTRNLKRADCPALWETSFFLLVALVGGSLPLKEKPVCTIVSYVLLMCYIDLELKNKDSRTHELLYFQVPWLSLCVYMCVYVHECVCVCGVCV